MLRMKTTEALDGYSRIRLVDSIDDKIMTEAKEKFEKYVRRGTIEKGSFGDDCWLLSDEVRKRTMNFSIPEGKAISEWTGCDSNAYTGYVKAYMVLILGDLAVTTMVSICKSLRLLVWQIMMLPVSGILKHPMFYSLL